MTENFIKSIEKNGQKKEEEGSEEKMIDIDDRQKRTNMHAIRVL